MARTLQDMVVIITGASAGIGRALAIALAGRGAKLVLAARRLDRLESLNASLGGKHLCVRCDVSKTADCEMLISAASEHFGRIDTLVCNAGYGMVRTVAETSAQEVRAMFETNVFGTVDCIRAAAPVFSQQAERDGFRGQVMIVSSAAARRSLPYFGHYSATKAAQLSFAEALRVELKPRKIAVTSVHPVGTKTDFFGVSETLGGAALPPETEAQVVQSAEQVARKMVRGITRPRAEVWPLGAARFALTFATLFPSLIDWAMGSARRKVEAFNTRGNK